MKANEIIVRQDRVVYTLMLLLACLGLLWSFWQHKQNVAIPGMTSEVQHAAPKPPTNSTISIK